MAELEKKIDALTAVLQAQQNGGPPPNPYHQPPPPVAAHLYQSDLPIPPQAYPSQQHESFSTPDTQRVNKRRRLDTAADAGPERALFDSVKADPSYNTSLEGQANTAASAHRHGRDFYQENSDTIRTRVKELVDSDMCNKIVDYYCTKLAACIPAVVLPPGTTGDFLLETKPVLLLAILAAGSPFHTTTAVREAIADELISCLADSLIQKGIKSLELIQAYVVFY